MPRMDLYLSDDTKSILDKACEISGMKPSPTVALALEEYVEREKDKKKNILLQIIKKGRLGK